MDHPSDPERDASAGDTAPTEPLSGAPSPSPPPPAEAPQPPPSQPPSQPAGAQQPAQQPEKPEQAIEPPRAEAPPPRPSPPPAPSPAPSRTPPRPPDAARCHRSLRPPVLEIWPYLSRPELLGRWLGETDLELAVGGAFSLKAWNGDVVRGRVLVADPPSTLAVTWRPHGSGPESCVEMRLQGDGPGSRVLVRHDKLSSEPERRQARRLWREVLGALHRSVQGGIDAHEWGAALPIAVRMPLARKSADVWPLLSTAGGLGKWLTRVERFDGTPEGAFRFLSRAPGQEVAEQGSIDVISPETRIVLAWEWAGASWEGRTKVELLLETEPSGTALLILHSGFDKIAPEAAAAARRHYAAFWPRAAADLRRLVAPVVA